MKTKLSIFLGILAIIGITSFVACEKSDVTPDQATSGVLDKKGGGNNPNSPNYNPCANYPVYPIVNLPATDWNITLDTTICGTMIFRWNAQPKFNPVIDSCYTIARYYYVGIAPLGGSSGCNVGNVVSTNSYYYTLGAGCSVWPGGTYVMGLTFYERNTVDQKVYVHTSLPFYFTAPTRAPFLSNC